MNEVDLPAVCPPDATGAPDDPSAEHRFTEPLGRAFADGLLVRGRRASETGDYARAEQLFERAALTFETIGERVLAADAYLEVGLTLLYQSRADEIPALGPRVARLTSIPCSCPGNTLLVRVFAAIIARAKDQPGPFVDLVDRRRRLSLPPARPMARPEPARSEAESAS